MWILGLFILNSILLLIIAVREARRPAKGLNWLVIGLVLPIIGFVLYWITSNPMHIRRERLTSLHNKSDLLPEFFSRTALGIAQSLHHFTVRGFRTSRVQMLINGEATYERLMKSLQNARRTIDLEYYIYKDDRIGRRITDILVERARAGVQIRFIRDGWGSRKFPKPQIARMTNAGIECRTIFPLRFPWILNTLNYRDHCKIVVIDGMEAYTGGINVSEEYAGLNPNIGFWRDTHVRIEGEAAGDLLTIFNTHWKIASPEGAKSREETELSHSVQGNRNSPGQASLGKAALSGWSGEWSSELSTLDDTSADNNTNNDRMTEAYVQTFEGNPGIPTQVIREVYFLCLTQATRTIDITNPYFLPDADIIMALKTAVARGVNVRLLVPRNILPKIVGLASRTYYGELLEAGVRIFMYNKGMLHAKIMIIDGEVTEVGSANYDLRSYRLNYEVCEIFYSAETAKVFTEQFECDLKDSEPLGLEELEQRSRTQRIVEQIARLLTPEL